MSYPIHAGFVRRAHVLKLVVFVSAMVCYLAAATHSAYAVLIASDAFATTGNGAGGTYSTDFDNGNGRIHSQNATAGVTGFTAGWADITPSTVTTQYRVETAELVHPLALGNVAGSVYTVNLGNVRATTRALPSYNQAGAEYYASSLLRAGQVPNSSGNIRIGLGLNEESAPSSFNGAKLEWGFDDNAIRVWVNDNPTTVLTGFTADETYLMTLGVEVNAVGSNERVTATLYNSVGNVIGAPVQITNHDFDIADLDFLRLSSTSASAYASNTVTPRFDNFRFGTTLNDVIFVAPVVAPAVPEPTSMALISLGALGLLWRKSREIAEIQ